jgi:hypothetical protein
LWWSRTDLGGTERLLRIRPPEPGHRDETLLNVVAVRPCRNPRAKSAVLEISQFQCLAAEPRYNILI